MSSSPEPVQLLCPVCSGALVTEGASLACGAGHRFDRARQGYYNLLLAQHKKSRHPGDTAEMIAARTRFLQSGAYFPIAKALTEQVDRCRNLAQGKINHLLDNGCGEGYYTDALLQGLWGADAVPDTIGVDISKPAILAASRRDRRVRWLVASSARLPLPDNSIDLAYTLFAPAPAEELFRVIRPGGYLIYANAGAEHLVELRRLIYEEVRSKAFVLPAALTSVFEHRPELSQPVSETLLLENREQIGDLLAMTPHFWRCSPERQAELRQRDQLTLKLDVRFETLTKG